ncbi:hypothetical protein EG329_003936 [Mollisiaceae sp. DMI_Dod_QoI]|nr:hypothetical protein EG329_003936 [Helotiales sp. DMI_Dod_QoI]
MSNSPSSWDWYSPQNNSLDPSSNDVNNSPWNDNYEHWTNLDDESLTLAPINPDNNFDNLPHLEDAGFDPPLRLSPYSDDPFLSQPSTESAQPPPSNQQAQFADREPPARTVSQYFLADAESPDPFEDFDPPPPPRDMAPSTRSGHQTRSSSSVVDLTESSPPQVRSELVQSRKRRAESAGEGRPSKSSKTILPPDPDDVPFVDLVGVENEQDYEELKAREQAEAVKALNQAEATKPVKLAEFKCIICMDDPTDLTVTHCGHLFCSECLHQALHAGDRKCCPVCRTLIVVNRAGQKPTNKGYFPLSMKLTTAKKQGKRPAKV